MNHCEDHSGFKIKIEEFCKFKESAKKTTMGVIGLLLLLLISLFGLTYNSQQQVMQDLQLVKIDIAVIKEALKK